MSPLIAEPDKIRYFQMLARRQALKLELMGMKRRGRTAYSICKSEYGLRGNRKRVYDQMLRLCEKTRNDIDNKETVR